MEVDSLGPLIVPLDVMLGESVALDIELGVAIAEADAIAELRGSF